MIVVGGESIRVQFRRRRKKLSGFADPFTAQPDLVSRRFKVEALFLKGTASRGKVLEDVEVMKQRERSTRGSSWSAVEVEAPMCAR
jgi:hypothetical protein